MNFCSMNISSQTMSPCPPQCLSLQEFFFVPYAFTDVNDERDIHKGDEVSFYMAKNKRSEEQNRTRKYFKCHHNNHYYGYYRVITIVERDTRKYHEFIAGYYSQMRSMSENT